MAEYGCPSRCRGECPDSDKMIDVPCTTDEAFVPPGVTGYYTQCCASDIRRACQTSSTTEAVDSSFRRADGKLYEGKTEIGGVNVPKVLVALGIVVGAYFIIKKMK